MRVFSPRLRLSFYRGKKSRFEGFGCDKGAHNLIVDDFLFAVIIVGLGVAVAYLKAEYALHADATATFAHHKIFDASFKCRATNA
jgi:hypothetical protein